jgi:hypothetical protein
MILKGDLRTRGNDLEWAWGITIEAWGSERLYGAPLGLLIRWHAMHLAMVQVCRV